MLFTHLNRLDDTEDITGFVLGIARAGFLKPEAAKQAEVRSAVMVPIEAVQRGYSRNFVWRFDEGHAREVRVEVGDQNGREVEILEGLSGGERLILGPHEGFRDGMRVSQK